MEPYWKKIGKIVVTAGLIGSYFSQIADRVDTIYASNSTMMTEQYPHKDKKLAHVSKGQLSNDKHNLLYQGSSQYVTTTNGYLTTESTFRPADIHYAGKKWQKSGNDDYRAVLAYWWPNKTIQVNYLKYMTTHGFASKAASAKVVSKFTPKTADKTLDAAAQAVRDAMEVKIAKDKSTKNVNATIARFVKTQTMWNKDSEYIVTDSLNNGYFKYQNNSGNLKSGNTSYANSKYRLLGRALLSQKTVAAQQFGGVYEFLLANDIDNSNPVVQAEDLNWAYYLQKFGTLTQLNDNANFDGVRIDAVDTINSDVLQLSDNLMQALYNVQGSEKNANDHLTIDEDWGTTYGTASYYSAHQNSQLAIDTGFFQSGKRFLLKSQKDKSGNQIGGGLQYLTGSGNDSQNAFLYSVVDRTKDSTQNAALPNYAFVRAHDQPTQSTISAIVAKQHPTLKDPMRSDFKLSFINQAYDFYYKDEAKATKQYAPYNIPSAYALLLTNKDVVPRIYYGDMYKENAQYMSQPGRYYKAITTMLKLRTATVAGGQAMTTNYDAKTNTGGDILTSVRYGTGIADSTSSATTTGRNQGSAVVISNNPKLAKQTITINMGIAHANQDYTLALGTTAKGLSYNTATYTTDDNGKLKLTIQGYANNPDVHGFLAYLVPKNLDQSVKVADDKSAQASATKSLYTVDGNVLHSNAALDTHVIYEGFSNFQPFATKKSDYANVVLARSDVQKNLKDWGITDFEFAPQYRSVKSNDFIDADLQNGYALSDRYDLGFGTPTKYGTATQLANAITAMHASGLHVLVDYVPNQIYGLNKKQVVTASRVDRFGNYLAPSGLKNILYLANTIGGGKYQAKYGGAFLSELSQKYPQLFTTKMISTGQTLPTTTKITEWQAQYLNGTGLQKNGAYQVLKDGLTNQYYYARTNDNTAYAKSFLPMSLLAVGYAHNGSFNPKINVIKQKNTGTISIDTFKGKGKKVKKVAKGNKITATSGKLTKVVKFNNKYIYYKNGRLQRNTKVKINKKTYRIDKSGYIVCFRSTPQKFTGVKKRGKHYVYYRNNRQLKNTKVKIGKKTYRINKSGYLLGYKPAAKKFTGVKKRGKHYVYYRNNRQLKNTKVKIGKKTYRINKSGYLLGYRR